MTENTENGISDDMKGSRAKIFSLMMVTAATLIATDKYLPSLPSIALDLNVSANQVQGTLSLYLLSFGIAHLLIGPLVPKYGHKNILSICLIIFILACLAAAFSRTITEFYISRAIQGASAAAPSVIVVIIIRKTFARAKALKFLGVYGVVVGLVPTVSPVLGGFIQQYYSWSMSFLLVAMIGLLSLLLCFYNITESSKEITESDSIYNALLTYLQILTKLEFMSYVMIGALLFAGLYAFITVIPFTLIVSRDVSPATYGIYQGISVSGYLIGAALLSILSERFSTERLLFIGLCGSVSGGFLFLVLALTGVLEAQYDWIMLAAGLYVFGLSIAIATIPILAFDSMNNDSNMGVASAVIGCFQVLGGSIGSHYISGYDSSRFITGALPLFIASIAAMSVFICFRYLLSRGVIRDVNQ